MSKRINRPSLATGHVRRAWQCRSRPENPILPVPNQVQPVARPTIGVPPDLPKPVGARFAPWRCEPDAKSKLARCGWSPPRRNMRFTSSSALSLCPFCNSAMARSCKTCEHASQRRQMWKQNGSGIVVVVIQRKSRIRQLARLPQFFNRRNRICSTPATRRRRAIAVAARRETRWSLPPARDNIVARLSGRSWLISASCRCHWRAIRRCGQPSIFQPVNNVRVRGRMESVARLLSKILTDNCWQQSASAQNSDRPAPAAERRWPNQNVRLWLPIRV